jgi:hypothetical protein
MDSVGEARKRILVPKGALGDFSTKSSFFVAMAGNL